MNKFPVCVFHYIRKKGEGREFGGGKSSKKGVERNLNTKYDNLSVILYNMGFSVTASASAAKAYLSYGYCSR